MPRSPAKDSGEKLQIAILTLAMTGGGFALLTAFLVFFWNPGEAQEADRLQRNYESLTQLLLKPETRALRQQAKINEGQDKSMSLGEIVKSQLDGFLLKYSGSFPSATSKDIKQGLQEQRLKITTEPAKLQSLLQFVAAVQDRKKNIQVEDVSFKRDSRSKADDDLWTVTAEFVDYVTK